MNHRPVRRAVLASAAALAAGWRLPVAAQEWPSKPVRFVVPVPPGGSLDLLARTLAKELTPRLGQPVLVENHGGAGGNIAFGIVAQAAPDGHTVLHGWDSLSINTALYSTVPYRLSQFQPVTLAITSPQVLVVNPARVPAGDLDSFLTAVRRKPGVITLGSPGSGSPGHLAGSLLEKLADVDIVHVPYKGGGPALADLVAGHLDSAIVTLPAALPHVRAGKLRALGVTTQRRAPGAPDIPTFQEAGVRGYELTSWQGFFVPTGTPGDAISRLNREIVAVLRTPEVRDQLVQQGFEVVAGGPEALAREVETGTPRWAQLVRSAGAKVD